MTLASWTSPKTKKGLPSQIAGKGFFAIEPIKKDEIVVVKAGHIIGRQQLSEIEPIVDDSWLPITDDLFMSPVQESELKDSMLYFNHSCEPNIGFGGNIVFVAMRDIESGEELNYDYAMDNADPEYVFECSCQSKNCRKTVTGNDWQNPALQQKYTGYFSWFVERKIKTIVKHLSQDL